MANLTVEKGRVAAVSVVEQLTLPAHVAVEAGQYLIVDPTTGRWVKGGAGSPALSRKGGIAIANAQANFPVTVVRKGVVDLGDALESLDFDADVFLSADVGRLSDADVSANEVQVVTITGAPDGGNFTLTFDGQTTGNIAHNAAASAVQLALEALSTIGVSNVHVTGSSGGPYTVTFIQDLAGANVPQMTASGAGLTGGETPGVTVTTSQGGVHGLVVGTVVPAFGSVGGDKLLRLDL